MGSLRGITDHPLCGVDADTWEPMQDPAAAAILDYFLIDHAGKKARVSKKKSQVLDRVEVTLFGAHLGGE